MGHPVCLVAFGASSRFCTSAKAHCVTSALGNRTLTVAHPGALRLPRRSNTVTNCAGGTPDQNDNQDERVDWDAAWKKVRQGLPEVESRSASSVRTQTPSFSRDAARSRREDIKQQEQLLLNLWTDEKLFLQAGLGIVALLLLFVVVIGPPPQH